MTVFVAVAYLTSAAVSLAISRASWRRRPAPGALGLALLCFAQFGWSATYALQWVLTSHEPSAAWHLARLVWLQAMPIAILIFVLDFAGWKRWLTRTTVALLLVQPIAALLLAATDPWHGLYLAGSSPDLVVTAGGPVFTFNALYSYALMLFAAGLLASRLTHKHPYRSQTAVVLLAVMLPVLQFLLQLAGLSLSTQVNTVPFTFTLAGAIEWFAITRLGLFRVLPVARDQLIEQLPDGIVVFDAQRLIVDINPAAISLTGARLPCIGKTADETFPEHAETIAALRAGLLAGDRASVQAPTSGGGVMEAVASSVVGRDRERIATLVTMRDITDEVRVTGELSARSEQLAAALERSDRILSAMTDGVLLVDVQATVIHDNPAARLILVGNPHSLEGRSVGELLPGIHGPGLITSALSTGEPFAISVLLPDGRSLVVATIPLLEAAPEGARALMVLRDETERLAAERMQRDFVANVSHELQTPLTGLSLLAATIARAMRDDPSSVEGFVERLGSETQRLTQLTRALTLLSRAESAATSQLFVGVDLSRIVTEEVAGLEHLAEAKGQSICVTAEPSVTRAGDDTGLRAVVANLAGNAIRYTQEGGSIAVRLRVETGAHGERWAVIEVEDDGPGIPLEHQARIFERFYRLDQARSSRTGGSGLGLSIVRHAAEQHGGLASVESEPGCGSRFTVRLPLEQERSSRR
jgi:two-component system sensor histidine kinase SenX3